jgi:hypothetical protein
MPLPLPLNRPLLLLLLPAAGHWVVWLKQLGSAGVHLMYASAQPSLGRRGGRLK